MSGGWHSWFVWVGSGGPFAGALQAAGESGRTSRVNALLSTAKAAVGSEQGTAIKISRSYVTIMIKSVIAAMRKGDRYDQQRNDCN